MIRDAKRLAETIYQQIEAESDDRRLYANTACLIICMELRLQESGAAFQ